MRLERNTQTNEYGFMLNGKPQLTGYPDRQEWFVAKQEAIDAAHEMGMIVMEDGEAIGQA